MRYILNPSLLGELRGYNIYSLSYSHIAGEYIDDFSWLFTGKFSSGGYGFFGDYKHINNYDNYERGKLVYNKEPYSVYGGFLLGINMFNYFSFGFDGSKVFLQRKQPCNGKYEQVNRGGCQIIV
jgi:hypothetical protein